ncbi:MAG: pantoate kinase [Aigarchaeota archaeon]|nr:pantoate kinase [Aigarchaeota archaeon]MDW8093298.1 pantoate kinase [Nitrososphaerota archaeon]
MCATLTQGNRTTTRSRIPLHVSGFFSPVLSLDPIRSGSIGAGIVISPGVECVFSTEVGEGAEVLMNGRPTQIEPVRYLLNKMGNWPVSMRFYTSAPLGVGYAVSASTAIASALGFAELLNKSETEAFKLAHEAEVVSTTGLGDVQAIATGGELVVRVKPGPPGIGEAYTLPVDRSLSFVGVGLGRMYTSEMFSVYGERIVKYGAIANEMFTRDPTLENFILTSEWFARNVGFMNDEISDAIKPVRGSIVGASVKKKLLFVLVEKEDVFYVVSHLRKIFGNAEVFEIGGGIWRTRPSQRVIQDIGL